VRFDNSGHPLSAAEVLELALEHRLHAERSNCPSEKLEFHRVADIYTVLATIDLPISFLLLLAS
jgi:hypothetical protein